MKNLTTYLNKAKAICDECGINYGRISEIVPNSRAKSRWGQCRKLPNGTYSININTALLGDEVSEEAILNTIVHEVLHTTPNGMCHTNEWLMNANKINRKHPELNIKRTTTSAEKGVDSGRKPKEVNYLVHCTGCTNVWKYSRYTKTLKTINRCKCPTCHSSLYVEEL